MLDEQQIDATLLKTLLCDFHLGLKSLTTNKAETIIRSDIWMHVIKRYRTPLINRTLMISNYASIGFTVSRQSKENTLFALIKKIYPLLNLFSLFGSEDYQLLFISGGYSFLLFYIFFIWPYDYRDLLLIALGSIKQLNGLKEDY